MDINNGVAPQHCPSRHFNVPCLCPTTNHYHECRRLNGRRRPEGLARTECLSLRCAARLARFTLGAGDTFLQRPTFPAIFLQREMVAFATTYQRQSQKGTAFASRIDGRTRNRPARTKFARFFRLVWLRSAASAVRYRFDSPWKSESLLRD